MDVNYGAAVKTYLTDHIKLLHIHRYCPSDVQFCDALVTSAIVVFEKAAPPPDHQVRLSLGQFPSTGPTASETVTLAALSGNPGNGPGLPGHQRGTPRRRTRSRGNLVSIKRGIAARYRGQRVLHPRAAGGGTKGHPHRIPASDPAQLQAPPQRGDRGRAGRLPAGAGKAAGDHRLRPAGAGHPDAAPSIIGNTSSKARP